MRSFACALAAAAALVCASASDSLQTASQNLESILQKPAHLRHGLTGSAMLGIAQQMRISDDAASAVGTFFFDQELDHFDPTSNSTYQQRYFINTQFWNNTGDAPVFLYVGGEGLLRVNSIGKVVTVGGSYPGALSAWARLRYPQSVHAAWASSGPVQADYDFFGYMDVVAASLADEAVGGSSQCVASLESAFSAIVAGVKSSDASTRSATVQPFCICDNYSAALSSLDAANVISTITNNIAYSVQYNEQLGAGLTVRDLCSVMGATQGQQAVQAYNTWYMKTTFKGASDCPAQCVDSRYSALLASQNVTSAQAEEAGVGVRSWYWQTCAEFSYFQTCEQNTACVFRGASALGDAVPMPYFTEVCTQDYAIPDVKTLVDATNEYFGGNSTVADRVVYTSGTVDPWHYLAVHHTIAPESPAVFIPGMSHCQDLHSEAPSDTPQLKAGRQQAVQHIKQWLQEE